MRATHCCLHRSQPRSNEITATERRFLRHTSEVSHIHGRGGEISHADHGRYVRVLLRHWLSRMAGRDPDEQLRVLSF